jgi:ATP-dependent RNA helicase RhlE
VLSGGDLLAGAQTGTGKTAGFTLPLLQRLSAMPRQKINGHLPIRALILAPPANWPPRSKKACASTASICR